MPYIVASETAVTSAASASYTQSIPAGHQANDILLAILSQDGGGTTIAVSGWTQIGTQAAAQAQRTTAFWKLAASGAESDLSATGATDDWVVTIAVIRGANTTTPINQENRTDSVNSTSNYLDSGTVTTDEDGCLIIQAFGWDFTNKITPEVPDALTIVGKDVSTGNVHFVGHYNQYAAGITPVVKAISEVATEGGTSLTIAIEDANPSSPQMGPETQQNYEVVKWLSGGAGGTGFSPQFDSLTWLAPDGITATSILGIPVNSTVPSITNVNVSGSPWGFGTGLTSGFNAGGGVGVWAGGSFTLTSTDLTDGLFALTFAMSFINTTIFGPEGVIAVFEDSGGAWVAVRLTSRTSLPATTSYTVFFDLPNTTAIASSGSVDWSDITTIGFLWNRYGTGTNSVSLIVKGMLIVDSAIMTGGCAGKPLDTTFIESAMNGWNSVGLASVQGSGQALGRSSVQIGDGTHSTYVDMSANSYELPLSANATLARRFWRVPVDAVEFRIKASADDTMNFTSCVIATDTRQSFVIDAASSASADYDFAGASIIGWVVTHSTAGITINGATLSGCHGITLNGGLLDGCNIVASVTSPALTTNDPENISNCAFTSAGTGHAIQISATGTYTFTGNTFTGYGADSTTDAALYNNSGGLVTLTLPAGVTPPTVRNGAGASTVFAYPPIYQSVTLTNGVADTRVQLYDLTDASEVYNDIPVSWPFTWTDPTPYAADREIRLRASYQDGTNAKLFIDQVIGTCTESEPAISARLNQEDDDVYSTNAIDGSLVTDIVIDDNNLLVEVDTGTVTWAQIYAYETYWLYTEVGIRDEGRFIEAPDTANYLLFDFKIKNVSSPSVPLIITGGYGVDGDTGSPLDIIDTTGGTIYCAPPHVVAYATAGNATQIADAVLGAVVDGGYTLAEVTRLQNAVLLGKIADAGTNTNTFRSIADTIDRVVATVDSSGNRTDITLDAS